jgi:hypothetical protein
MPEKKKHFSLNRYWTIVFPVILLSALSFGIYVLFSSENVMQTPLYQNVKAVRNINLRKKSP